MVHKDLAARVENVNQQPNPSAEHQEYAVPSQQLRDITSSLPTAGTNYLPLVERLLTCQGLSKEASEIISKSWRSGTAKQYRLHLQKSQLFCVRKNIDPLHSSVQERVNFPAECCQECVILNYHPSKRTNVWKPPPSNAFPGESLRTSSK